MGTAVRNTVISMVCSALTILVFIPPGEAVDSLVVSLEGPPGGNDFLQVGSGLEYQLKCQYRAAYDDVVQTVSWTDFGREVYSYSFTTKSITVSHPLRGLVSLSPSSDPQNIHITKAAMSITGTYRCKVSSTKGTVESDPINIRVINIAPREFKTSVDILSNIDNTTSTTTSTTPPTNSSSFGPPGPNPTDPSCMLVWSFSTPAIAPRPNVTCGTYSYSHDDIKGIVAGGMQVHQLQNNSWQAEIKQTKIPVMEIPYEGRLGCKITIPNTSYRKIVKFEDGLSVDHLIDSKGCPTLAGLTDYFGIQQEVQGATSSCRGDLTPSSKMEAARAVLSCPAAARHRDGSVVSSWRMQISCIYQEMFWRELSVAENKAREDVPEAEEISEDPMMMGDDEGENMSADNRKISDIIDIEKFPWPLCIGGVSASYTSAALVLHPSHWLIILVTILTGNLFL